MPPAKCFRRDDETFTEKSLADFGRHFARLLTTPPNVELIRAT